MKKVVISVICALFACVGLVAESAVKYQVNSVTGKVQFEESAGVWKSVEKDMKLDSSAQVNTGLNSVLVVTDGTRTYTLKPMQKGTVADLCKAVAVKKSGVTIGSKLATSDIDASAVKSRSSISTASTRAASADEGVDWAE